MIELSRKKCEQNKRKTKIYMYVNVPHMRHLDICVIT